MTVKTSAEHWHAGHRPSEGRQSAGLQRFPLAAVCSADPGSPLAAASVKQSCFLRQELKLCWVTGTIGSLLFALFPFPWPWHAWGGREEPAESCTLLHCSCSLSCSISGFTRQPVSFSKFLWHSALRAAALLGGSQGLF